MIRYSVLFLVAALLPLVTAAGVREPCSTDDDCDEPLSCVGRPTNMKCFMKKGRGMSCGKDPFWVCEDGLVCEDDICKVAARGECNEPESTCVGGLSCVGNEGNMKCFMKKGEGMKCGKDPFWVCEDRLACVNNVCRRMVGRNRRCGRKRVCRERLVCAGPRRTMRCVRPGLPGRRCGMFDTCSDSTCVDGMCVLEDM